MTTSYSLFDFEDEEVAVAELTDALETLRDETVETVTALVETDDPPALFSKEELIPWLAEWQNMPSYEHADLAAKYQIVLNFACAADVVDFARLIGQKINPSENGRQLQSFWFPAQEIGHYANKRYIRRRSP